MSVGSASGRPDLPRVGRVGVRLLRVWVSLHALELAIVEYVGWFNLDRLHGFLGDLPPAEFEALYAPQTKTTITL